MKEQSGWSIAKGGDIRTLVVLMLVVVVICIGFGLAVVTLLDTWEHRAQFGDMFGALSALFSALAFAGVVYAILLQREEMRNSREAFAAEQRLISEQVKLMNDALLFERRKERVARAPSISFGRDLTLSEGLRTFSLRNAGEPIADVEVHVDSPSDVSVTPARLDRWGKGQDVRFEFRGFKGRKCPGCILLLRFKDMLKELGEQEIKIEPTNPERMMDFKETGDFDGDVRLGKDGEA
jgi:hypothetical protein